ncbi:PREDICTED: uncharacterized protein LOC108367341 [Rhagoletis zephyria]|uniref:uncharacterized protein LOC108367341 n=1 Tax=Rhagoletis zephyria TaxID=28612 RepID=UPI0008119321|nr:PREDICTED: uncharacterized protein LOC108367341 [Rhagoletis zephyria]
MIICDSDMVIQAEDASRPGSSHDAFVFNMSNAKQHYLSKYEAGDRGSWLLRDSGFGIESFLLTPYRDPNPGSPQHRHYQIEDFVETESTTQPEEIFEENTELEENTNLNNVGRNLRDSIANNLIL